MEKSRPEGTALLITVSSEPGKYEEGWHFSTQIPLLIIEYLRMRFKGMFFLIRAEMRYYGIVVRK